MRRNGKIARLPKGIREELNRRLRDGKFGPALLKWLNEQRECQDVLDKEFDGRSITKQNLSEWRQGGYEDWLRNEEARQRVQALMEKAGDLENEAGGMAIADRLGTLLAAELAVEMEQLESIQDPKERWARRKDIAQELYRLRREDHHARKLRMAEEQWAIQSKREAKKKLLKLQEAMREKPLAAALHEGKTDRWKWADWEIRVKHDLPMPKWWTNPQTAEEWAELMRPYWWGEAPNSPQSAVRSPQSRTKRGGAGVEGNGNAESHGRDARATKAKSKRVRPGRTGSGQKSESVASGPSESKSETREVTQGNEGGQEDAPRSAQSKAPSPLRSAGAAQRASGPVSEQVEGAVTEGGIAKPGAEDENEDEQGASG